MIDLKCWLHPVHRLRRARVPKCNKNWWWLLIQFSSFWKSIFCFRYIHVRLVYIIPITSSQHERRKKTPLKPMTFISSRLASSNRRQRIINLSKSQASRRRPKRLKEKNLFFHSTSDFCVYIRLLSILPHEFPSRLFGWNWNFFMILLWFHLPLVYTLTSDADSNVFGCFSLFDDGFFPALSREREKNWFLFTLSNFETCNRNTNKMLCSTDSGAYKSFVNLNKNV